MDGTSRSRGWDKEIPHGVLPMVQLVLRDKWARIRVIPYFRFKCVRKCVFAYMVATPIILLDFSLSVKAAPHECVIRTGQPKT